MDGKVDVWSAEGVGTEIKVTFNAEVVEGPSEAPTFAAELEKVLEHGQRPTISLLAFDDTSRGVQLLRKLLLQYLATDWGFPIVEDGDGGDIVVVNEDPTPVTQAIERKHALRPFIILSSARGDPRLMAIVNEYEHIGGFCRIVYKPVGPCRLVAALKLSLHALNIGRSVRTTPLLNHAARPDSPSRSTSYDSPENSLLARRLAGEANGEVNMPFTTRPPLGPRAITAHPSMSWSYMPSTVEQEEPDSDSTPSSPQMTQMTQMPSTPMISVGNSGTLLKSSMGTIEQSGPLRVLVVEDNSILRNLL